MPGTKPGKCFRRLLLALGGGAAPAELLSRDELELFGETGDGERTTSSGDSRPDNADGSKVPSSPFNERSADLSRVDSRVSSSDSDVSSCS